MDLNSLKKTQMMAVALPLFACILGGSPIPAAAGDMPVPVQDVSRSQQIKRTLYGTVVDASSGETLVGVTVRIKGSDVYAVTDLDGRFELEVTDKTELECSYISYKTQTVMVGDLGVIQIKMVSDNEVLDEVIVIGAGTQKKVSVTGSISSVKGNALRAPASSLTGNLAGKLSGVIARTNSGEPGATSEFYIRGINTFGGVATPLILLNGVEISAGDLNNLPAETIESFTVLKDASATAIYGNRGANGVMLVTTKSGMENTKAVVNVSLESSYFQPMNRIQFADGVTYMNTFNEARLARGMAPVYSAEQIQYTAEGVNRYAYPDVDWYDLIFRKGNFNQRANINVQGGGSRVTYFLSLQANHDTGLLNTPKNYFYDTNFNTWEYNFQNNITYKLTNTTIVDLRLMAQIGNRKGPEYSTASLYKSVMATNPVVFPAFFPEEEGDRGHVRFGNSLLFPGIYGENPYANLLKSFQELNYNTVNTSLNVTQKLDFITEGLSVKALVNFKNFSQAQYKRSIDPFYYQMKANSYDYETDTYELDVLRTGKYFIEESNHTKYQDQTFYFDVRVDWKRSFGNHNVTAMAMYMMREYRVDKLPNRNQGYSGRITYDYANRYLVEFNFGYNGSERLAKGTRFEFFPAVSLGWVASNEKFWLPVAPYINHFKIRGSYGLVGSDLFSGDAPHFLYINQLNFNPGFSGYGYSTGMPGGTIDRTGVSFETLAVQNAGWERVKKLNVGVDVSLFNQVNVSVDYFRDYRERILMKRSSFPSMLGYGWFAPWSNIGEVLNHGVELSVNWSKQFGRDWYVDLRGNFTYNRNEYKYVDEADYPYTWQTKTGKPLNTLTGYVADGLFSSYEEIEHWADQSQLGGSNLRPGDIKYRDINGDGMITEQDQVMLSPYGSMPNIQYGFGITVTWKKLDFGVFFNGSAKRRIMINEGYAPFQSGGGDGQPGETLPTNLMKWIADGHWSESNPDPNAVYPRLGTTISDIQNNIVPSSYWVRDAGFLRFKTLEIGYTFPHCRVYFSGDNIAVFSPFKLWDPELAWNAYPLQRTFNIGVQLTF